MLGYVKTKHDFSFFNFLYFFLLKYDIYLEKLKRKKRERDREREGDFYQITHDH